MFCFASTIKPPWHFLSGLTRCIVSNKNDISLSWHFRIDTVMWSAPSYFCWWVWLALPRPSIFLSSDSWFFHSKKRRRESCRYALCIKGLTSGVAEVRLWKWLPTLCQCARVWEHTWVIWGRCSKRCDFGRRSVRHGCEKRGWRWGQGQSTSHGESGKLPKKEVFFCKNDPSL